jgi:hypothetical protein
LVNKSDYTNDEKLFVYQEHKKLTYAIKMTASDDSYNFILREGKGQGKYIEGNITKSGSIKLVIDEASVNTCPICLAKGTLIDTLAGQIPVEQLIKGMYVWTLDNSGNRVVTEIVEISATPVPTFFCVIKMELSDGRNVITSPGHPTDGGKPIADYQAGDILGGAQVVKTEYITYESSMTYDILPDGATGLYWANGILLGSTLKIDRTAIYQK